MSIITDAWHWLTGEELETRTESDSIADLTARISGSRSAVWRVASIREAMGVPAVFGIVSTIANTVGSLSLDGYRNGMRLAASARPPLIVRPDPFRRPGSFWRDSAWNLASRGEAWWWVAKRDNDGGAMSLINVPPREVMVTEDQRDLRYPIIEWRGRRMRNEDMRQITYVREPGELRGVGPLQLCGAAVSVAVEAQEWAANFYADGGNPSVVIKSAEALGEGEDGSSEADTLRDQWTSRPNNVPRVIDPSIEGVEYLQPNAQGAQMLQARDFQTGEFARMFSYPPSLVGYSVPGSSVTYQNVEQELDKLTRTCLIPFYLEKFEQELSDLLTRSTTCEFNTSRLLRASPKTRWETYELIGRVLGAEAAAEYASQQEGFTPGGIETAPVPFARPQAVPSALPIQERSLAVRCDGSHVIRDRIVRCNRLLAESGPFTGRCPRCKKEHRDAA